MTMGSGSSLPLLYKYIYVYYVRLNLRVTSYRLRLCNVYKPLSWKTEKQNLSAVLQ
jgi:hypothetical protein